jgi:hypothetical protein
MVRQPEVIPHTGAFRDPCVSRVGMHHQHTHVLAKPPCWHADGNFRGGSGRQVTELVSARVHLREELREFIGATAKDDYS